MSRLNTVEHILKNYRTIAVVGFSSNVGKAGYYVPQYMQKHGYRIIPVNPFITSGLDETAYASLFDIPFPVDVVEIFRRPAFVPPFAREAAQIGAKAIWLQRDITSKEARATADLHGLHYVEDRCMMVEHRHLIQYGWGGLEPLTETA